MTLERISTSMTLALSIIGLALAVEAAHGQQVQPANVERVESGDSEVTGERPIAELALADESRTTLGTNNEIEGPLRITSPYGYVDVGPKNQYFSHFYTDMPRYYFDRQVWVNTGRIGSYRADLLLTTDGTVRMAVKDANGFVGIGKTDPAAKLDVAGDVAVNGQRVIDASGNWVGNGVPSIATAAACAKQIGSSGLYCSSICQGSDRVVTEKIIQHSIANIVECTAATGGESCSETIAPGENGLTRAICCACEVIH